MNRYKKIITCLTIVSFLVIQNPSAMVAFAEEVAETPAPQIESSQPIETPSIPDIPQDIPDAPEVPTVPEVPVYGSPTTTPIPEITETETIDPEREAWRKERDERRAKETAEKEAQTQIQSAHQNGIEDSGNVGDTLIKTGDATNSSQLATHVNESTSAGVAPETNAVSILNTENGSHSSNTGATTNTNSSTTDQTNSAVITNNLDQTSLTGGNTSSRNVGDTTIDTGNANTTGTIVNSVNTNVDGVMVSEFNVVDDQTGDVLLDFTANCISGCDSSSSVTNQANGDDSYNEGEIESISNSNTFQNNDATIENELSLVSDSGWNSANKNTAGNTTLETGDASVNANILNFANNNISGNVIYGVVNIFGDLVGDIVMPDIGHLDCCGGPTYLANTNNGSGSQNSAVSNTVDTATINQFNTADIENNIIVDVNSGGNDVTGNTNGDNTIKTGDISLIAQTVNIANLNLIGGNYWLVLVNEAGQWLGKIIGQGDDTTIAGSNNLAFALDQNGDVSVSNTENGNNSTNIGTINRDSQTTITQSNDAKIVNNVNLTANTGNNSASKNTGGNSSITTGDATVVANIVNFVNNNIVGNGKLLVTVVNVFGSWVGDFVGPGGKSEDPPILTGHTQNESEPARGGLSNQTNSNASNNAPQVLGTSIAQTITKKLAKKVLGTADVEGETSVEVIEEPTTEELELPQVASSQSGRKKITINLAWSLLGIPLFGAFLITKKRRNKVNR